MINQREIDLNVGVFTIHISNRLTNNPAFQLPDSIDMFIDKQLVNQTIINYAIQLGEPYEVADELLVSGFDNGPYPYFIYKYSTGEYLWVRENKFNNIQFVFRISHNWDYWYLLVDNSKNPGIDSFKELAYIFGYSILGKGGILFHGVVMEWRGIGIIVCAHSGVGKTTHTRMWRDREGALILNGDRALCCKEDNNWYAYGAPWSGSSGEFKSRRVKLQAVVVLEQAANNEISILSPLQGAFELMELAFAPDWQENLINCALDSIDNIVNSIPVYKLKCRPDIEAVDVLKAELEKLVT